MLRRIGAAALAMSMSAALDSACCETVRNMTSPIEPHDPLPSFLELRAEKKPPPLPLEDEFPKPGDYAGGTGAIFWIEGMPTEDYPYSCKCEKRDLEGWLNIANGAPADEDDWWDPPDKFNPSLSYVRCDSTVSSGIGKSSQAYCDPHNTARPKLGLQSWAAAVSFFLLADVMS
eukprot:Polyplicarium_translucidae@DN193_c0_g1_i1.p1